MEDAREPASEPGEADRPGIVAPPPALYAGAILLGFLLQWLWPLPLPGGAALRVLGILLVAGGVALGGAAAREFRRHRTSINPYRPSTTILESGPFAYSRNPVYLGLAVAQFGLALATASAWIVLTLVPVLAILRTGVIDREERYLARKFGDRYEAYRSRVPRWL